MSVQGCDGLLTLSGTRFPCEKPRGHDGGCRNADNVWHEPFVGRGTPNLTVLLAHQWRHFPSPKCGCGLTLADTVWHELPYAEAHAQHLIAVLSGVTA